MSNNQDYEMKVIREASILTELPVSTIVRGSNDNLDLTSKNQVVLLLDFIIGNLTSLDLKVEFSHNNIDYYQETAIETIGSIGKISLFEYVFLEGGKYRVSFPIKDRFMKISVNGTGDITDSSLKITSITGLT